MNNFFVIVLDGIGIGELPDSANYGDEGSNTLSNMANYVGGLNLPNMQKMGLGNIYPIKGVLPADFPVASYGKMKEISKGKDSTTGHWELSGLRIDIEFSYFPEGFPEYIIKKFTELTGCKGVLGNKAASGTEIIQELGDKHIESGYPIIYTSADSVFQIAAHEQIIPLQRLYEICIISRTKILLPPLNVGRVIARPFEGSSGNYRRTVHRKDFTIDPPDKTILDYLYQSGIKTVAIGKVNDLFNYCGIRIKEPTKSNEEGTNKLIKYAKSADNSFIFANLVDFDVYYGHRNDPYGFANALKEFDNFLSDFMNILDPSDHLILTSDHGNDPTTPSTDHSREYVPLLYYRKGKKGTNLGLRDTYSDVAKTVSDFFMIENDLKGKSFLIKN